MVKPYEDERDGTTIIRTFDENVIEEELVWHRDYSSREVTILEGSGWKLQLDNQLPKEMIPGQIYMIPKMMYHRIIKGEGNLKVKIWELDD